MKTLILSVLMLSIAYTSGAQYVNIPDANFKNALIEAGVDTDENGEISYDEAEAVTSLDLEGEYICDEETCWIVNGVDSLDGIQAFTNLDSLNCRINNLTSLDLSSNTALKWLWCDLNQLTSLDISGCAALTYLHCGCFHWGCGGNQLTSLDVSNNVALKYLSCGANQLTSLDVSNNAALEELSCDHNQLTSLNVSNNAALIGLGCGDNQLTSLDVSDCTSLIGLGCPDNQLTSLDASGCNALTGLDCRFNQLTSLDVSGCTALTELDCRRNQLFNLDVSNNIALTSLLCPYNQLNSLDVYNNSALTELDCRGNQLTSLNIAGCNALTVLRIDQIPTLYEVCVWESFPAGVSVETEDSPNVQFTTDCSITALNPDKENSTINIYPNPSADIINIEIENTNNATIEIYNISGTLIFSKGLQSQQEKINISGYSKGIYLLKVRQADAVYVEKLVVK